MEADVIFMDMEVLKHDWLGTFKSYKEQKYEFFHNERDALIDYMNAHRDDIFVGYNIREYDNWIMKAIYCNYSPKSVSDMIIRQKIKGWRIFQSAPTPEILFYDAMPAGNPPPKLKLLEAFAGVSIEETPISFDIDRPLTADEIEQMFNYNIADVDNVEMVWTKLHDDFEAQSLLIQEFNLPQSAYSKTKAQTVASILGARRREWTDDEFDIVIPDNLILNKYHDAIDWFLNPKNHFIGAQKQIIISGMPHNLAWGGFHCVNPKSMNYPARHFWEQQSIKEDIDIDFLNELNKNYNLFTEADLDFEPPALNVDADSFYPMIIVLYDLMSRAVPESGKELFRYIVFNRLELKKQGSPLAYPFKIVVNSCFGAFIFPGSALYDPRQGRNVCVLGQLFLLDLIEKIEPYAKIINSNTDGVMFKPYSWAEVPICLEICKEWEERTGFKLGFDKITKIYQKDVNNYIWIDSNGNPKRKGAYREWELVKGDMKIIANGVYNHFVNGISAAETVQTCNDLKMFQKVIDVGKFDDFRDITGRPYKNKVMRTFATTSADYQMIRKSRNGILNKISYLPERVKIVNGDITNAPIPDWLDLKYYENAIEEAIQVLKEPTKQKTLSEFTTGNMPATEQANKLKDLLSRRNG